MSGYLEEIKQIAKCEQFLTHKNSKFSWENSGRQITGINHESSWLKQK